MRRKGAARVAGEPRTSVPILPAMRASRAFTITELLVVVAVIGVLVGVVLPGARLVQRETRNVNCLSNLRQGFGAIQLYATNNRDVLPMCEFIPVVTDEGPEGGLPLLLQGYLPHDSACWCCPADLNEDSLSTGTSYLYAPGLLRYMPQVQAQVIGALLAHPPGSQTPSQFAHLRRDIEARTMTAFYRTNPASFPLLVDSEDRHERNGSQRNGVFMDGSARPADPPPDNDPVMEEGVER